ncbi:MAG: succinylglutamate desuccinylase/aspartoacylase family protein [Synergistaceae bacterium]|nr:succinylglutamate desuccinylase/aspartoacylase family protein [Synergistaceae bacterium]
MTSLFSDNNYEIEAHDFKPNACGTARPYIKSELKAGMKLHALHVEPGTKQLVKFNFNGGEIPATFIHGLHVKDQPEKTLVITAGVHPDEYPGIAALVRAANKINPEKLHGHLLLFHCVNLPGFWARSRFVPEDGFNLNSGYPGKADGTLGERIANFFVTNIFPQADFILDLHSGSPTERLTTCLFYPEDARADVRETAFNAAMATDIPWVLASHAKDGEYSYAANYMNVPGLLLERGYAGQCREEWIRGFERDIALLLKHLGMYDDLPELTNIPPCRKNICAHTFYLESRHTGLWYPDENIVNSIMEGRIIRKGSRLGHIENFYGEFLGDYYAEADGIIFYYTSGLAIREGDLLVAYGLLN